MKIFISWSKSKSRRLADATKLFLQKILNNNVEIFFSPDMYKGTCVDHVIHDNLLNCDKCIVCITLENYKNPWLMYEAGVVYGAHYQKPGGGIVIPLLFDSIPEWSSWIDKPLNRYVPIRFSNSDEKSAKSEFKKFIDELSCELSISVNTSSFNKKWSIYYKDVKNILSEGQLVPDTCIDLVNLLMNDNDVTFTVVSPEITKKHILFHKGFATNVLMRLLLKNVIYNQGKKLWIFGRRNKKLMTSENDDFFKFLYNEGIDNGVDFKCLFPLPKSEAMIKAVSKDKERRFLADLQTCLEAAVRLQRRFNIPVEQLFRLYNVHRTDSIIVCDNAVIHSDIVCDSEGYPLPITNSAFEILSVINNNDSNKGRYYADKFLDVWNKSIPLTEELYCRLYNVPLS